jgi:hypothetical protein
MNSKRSGIPYWTVPVFVFFPLIAGFFGKSAVSRLYWQNKPQMQDIWAIGMVSGTSPLNLTDMGIQNPVLTAKNVTDMDCVFVADPFIVKEGGTWYMFFEALDRLSNKGRIACALSQDGLRWTYKNVVLKERFHLSYPYVFKYQGDYYMIPESHEDYSVRLYKAAEFPDKWVPVDTLLHGEFVDSSVFQLNGLWWLFTTDLVDKERNNVLRLYTSQSLSGPWQEHPESPLSACTSHNSRCGGRVLVAGSQAFRIAQDDFGTYGNRLRAFKITTLTLKSYREAEVPWPIVISAQPWNTEGIHSLDPHVTATGTWLGAIDGHSLQPSSRNK